MNGYCLVGASFAFAVHPFPARLSFGASFFGKHHSRAGCVGAGFVFAGCFAGVGLWLGEAGCGAALCWGVSLRRSAFRGLPSGTAFGDCLWGLPSGCWAGSPHRVGPPPKQSGGPCGVGQLCRVLARPLPLYRPGWAHNGRVHGRHDVSSHFRQL